jgi:3-isopropylmalate/(R)-2-methylmalate dehydratase small subunit
MRAFTQHTGIAAPLLRDNIDTDAIIPSREMKTVSKSGLADGLFAPWRYTDAVARIANPEFALNQLAYAKANILISGHNFGCGSSREHAVWALVEYGFRAILAHSFGSIFKNNAVRNGLLPIELKWPDLEAIASWVSSDPDNHQIEIDLEQQTLIAGPLGVLNFDIDAQAKTMLLNGLDEIGLTEQLTKDISAFEERDRKRRPWIYLPDQSLD